MPYCEILSSHFLHMDLASWICISKPRVLNSIPQDNNALVNKHIKSQNFERFHPVQHNFHMNLDKNILKTVCTNYEQVSTGQF